MERLFDGGEFEDIRENYKRISENINEAAIKAGRTDKPRFMAVTKTVSPERINYAISLGIDLLGENRVQEYLEKRDAYAPAEVHFIGALQTNKVKYIIDKVSMIHSVNSVHLAEEINRRAASHGLTMDILAEINIGGEETKSGISREDADVLLRGLSGLSNVRLRGLMAIPPPDCGEKPFADMRELFEQTRETLSDENRGAFDTLSMGMSGDYETAIKFGATIVRIGSALFGQRKYPV